jgi:hypothetical protein
MKAMESYSSIAAASPPACLAVGVKENGHAEYSLLCGKEGQREQPSREALLGSLMRSATWTGWRDRAQKAGFGGLSRRPGGAGTHPLRNQPGPAGRVQRPSPFRDRRRRIGPNSFTSAIKVRVDQIRTALERAAPGRPAVKSLPMDTRGERSPTTATTTPPSSTAAANQEVTLLDNDHDARIERTHMTGLQKSRPGRFAPDRHPPGALAHTGVGARPR